MTEHSITYNVRLNAQKIFRNLSLTVFALAGINFLLQMLYYIAGLDIKGFGTLRHMFNVDDEKNIPTLFTFVILIFTASMLAVISIVKRNRNDKYEKLWWLLTFLFLFLGIDEILESHEYLAIVLRKLFNFTGIFWFAWVIPFSFILIGLTFIFYRFIFYHLPAETRKMFIVSGMIYIGGALGMELIGGYFFTTTGKENMTWVMLTIIEESMEMFGVIFFINTLMNYFRKDIGKVEFSITDSNMKLR